MDFDELRAFIAVAEHGSFLAAAEELFQSRTTLRRHIEALEAKSGTPLLHRTKRGVTPTEAGEVLLARGRLLVRDSQALLASVREVGREPTGCLRVVLPQGLPPQAYAPLVGAYRARCPAVSLRVSESRDPVSELLGDVDLAVCLGVTAPAGPWEVREVAEVREWLVASEGYLRRHGTPRTVEDLADHTLLAWSAPGGDPELWTLLGGGTFPVAPALVTSNIHMLRTCARAGQGIALAPDALLPDPADAKGALVPVLPDVVGRRRVLQLVVPAALAAVPKVRAALDIADGLMDAIRGLRAGAPGPATRRA